MHVLDLRTISAAELGGDLLLVEDDPMDVDLMNMWLKRSEMSWNVTHCKTLTSALASLESSRPTLIISDLGLPDAEGLMAAEQLIVAAPDIPLIVLTGSTRTDMGIDALDAGAQDYINKDEVNENTLRRAVRFALTRHAAQRRLASLEGSLAEADGDLEEYASMVAHDLRAPLRTSRLLAGAIAEKLTDSDAQPRDLADRLETTLGHLDEMVLSMLDYSGLRNVEVPTENIVVAELVDEVLLALEADLSDSGATITVDVDPGCKASASKAALWRVFENLLSNAIKFHDPERPLEIEIALRACTNGERVRVAVRDNGIGIPEDECERVMRPLERLDSSIEGSGFGLAICRRELLSFGAKIWIDPSESVDGTTFIVELPIAD